MKRNEPESKIKHEDIFNFGNEKTETEPVEPATTPDPEPVYENETIQNRKSSGIRGLLLNPWMVCAGALVISIVVAINMFSGKPTLASEPQALQPNNLPELLGPQPWYSNGEQVQPSFRTNLVCDNLDILCMTFQTNEPNKSLSGLSSMIQQEKEGEQLYEIEIHVRKL